MAPGSSELLQYFYATCILVVPVFCGLERTCTPEVKDQGRRGTCGSQLTQLISLACMFRGGYSMDGKKRSVDQTELSDAKPHSIPIPVANKTLPKTLEDFKEQLKKQFVSKRQAASFLVKKSAYAEQGIVCECCYFRCSFREITDYCQDDHGFFKRSSPSDKKGIKDMKTDNILDKYHIGLSKQVTTDDKDKLQDVH